ITSLGLVQMTRKKLGLGLLETFGEPCEVCAGRGLIIHHEPVGKARVEGSPEPGASRRGRGKQTTQPKQQPGQTGTHEITDGARSALAAIATATVHHDSADGATAARRGKPISNLDSLLDALPEAPEPGARTARRPRRATKKATSDTSTDESTQTN
ncbi:MAG: hypothetical protein RL378_364, partial [Actinomycetota bacterium]